MKPVLVAIVLITLFVSSEGREWYETAAFYQIYPQTFFDGGDVADYQGTGTFKGIEDKLDYIKDLGIDCIWLTPIFRSTFNSYGYDITGYKNIDPRYGSTQSFEKLIKSVHEKGMKIIVDFVPNHCSSEHEFFQKSIRQEEDYDDWFVWTNTTNFVDADGKAKPSNWQRIGGPLGSGWTEEAARKGYFYAQFSPTMPDLNLRNEKVKDYMKGVMEYWLDRGLDGFRIDAISHGFEALPKSDGKYENENRDPKVNETDVNNFGLLFHDFTQDQPELFSLIYEWRKFLNDYQQSKSGEARYLSVISK
jgi:alpha-glucosidase